MLHGIVKDSELLDNGVRLIKDFELVSVSVPLTDKCKSHWFVKHCCCKHKNHCNAFFNSEDEKRFVCGECDNNKINNGENK